MKRNPQRTPLLIHGSTGGDAVFSWWQQHMTQVLVRYAYSGFTSCAVWATRLGFDKFYSRVEFFRLLDGYYSIGIKHGTGEKF